MIIPLSKRFQYEDYDLTEIDLDFENAPANVLRRADMEVSRRKHVMQMKQQDTLYCGLIASMITKIPYEVLESLPLKDFNLITECVSSFLLSSEEPRTTPPESSGDLH